MQLFNNLHGKQCGNELIHENKKQQVGVFRCVILSVTYGELRWNAQCYFWCSESNVV